MSFKASVKRTNLLLDVVFPLAVLGVTGWLLVFVATSIIRALSSAQSEIATAIIAGSVTITLSVVGVLISKAYERRSALEQESRARRIPVYEDFLGILFRLMQQGKPGVKKLTDAEMVKIFSDSTQRIAVWSSDDALRQFIRFRSAALTQSPDTPGRQTMLEFEDLILAV